MLLTQKICLTPEEQIAFLAAHGISFADKNSAKWILQHIGLAHLKPYWLNGMTNKFNGIIELYKFDSDLKLLFIEALAAIEISVRNSWIRCLADPQKAYSPLHYCDAEIYTNPGKSITEFKNNRDQTNRIYIQKYKDNNTMPPIWKMAEIISFGCLSRSIRNLKTNEISPKSIILISVILLLFCSDWLMCAIYVRIMILYGIIKSES